MDDIEAFLLASAAAGIMTAKAKINMDMKIVEIPAWKPNCQTSLQQKVGLFSPLSVLAGRRSRSGSDVSFSGRGCVLDEV